jgi:hypothetical protein
LVGQKPKHLSDAFRNFMGLLAYWRDAAAHGKFSVIAQANADEALRQLLHLSQWAASNWDSITQ